MKEKTKKVKNKKKIIIGIIFAAVFAASTAYSGMKAGLTVAAGIPGAILGSAFIHSLHDREPYHSTA